jgi:hypothetical protein
MRRAHCWRGLTVIKLREAMKQTLQLDEIGFKFTVHDLWRAVQSDRTVGFLSHAVRTSGFWDGYPARQSQIHCLVSAIFVRIEVRGEELVNFMACSNKNASIYSIYCGCQLVLAAAGYDRELPFRASPVC